MKTKKLSNIIGSCDIITQNEYSETPFWKQKELKVDNTLADMINKETDTDETMKRLANDKVLEYRDSILVYTDASKRTDGRTGVSYRIPSLHIAKQHRFVNDASIFTAEAAAILLALKNQNISKTQRDVAIFTDCLEVTNALKEEISKTSPCIVNQIRHESDQLQRSMKIQICVVWIPGPRW